MYPFYLHLLFSPVRSTVPEELRLMEMGPERRYAYYSASGADWSCSVPSDDTSTCVDTLHRRAARAKSMSKIDMLWEFPTKEHWKEYNTSDPVVGKREQHQTMLLKIMGEAYRYSWEDLYNSAMDEYRVGERQINRTDPASLIPPSQDCLEYSDIRITFANVLCRVCILHKPWVEGSAGKQGL